MSVPFVLGLILLLCFGSPLALAAQAKAQDTAETPFTLHTGTRIVLTDVCVTDRMGRSVPGLSRSAFHILDNGKPQMVTSFQEHTGAQDVVERPLLPGRFTNDYLHNSPAAFAVLLIDTVKMSSVDQMSLAADLKQSLAGLPAHERIAVYTRSGLSPVLLQDFTSNHHLLFNAIEKAAPRFPQTDAEYSSDTEALIAMIGALRNLPGRKNLILFLGGINVDIHTNCSAAQAGADMLTI